MINISYLSFSKEYTVIWKIKVKELKLKIKFFQVKIKFWPFFKENQIFGFPCCSTFGDLSIEV